MIIEFSGLGPVLQEVTELVSIAPASGVGQGSFTRSPGKTSCRASARARPPRRYHWTCGVHRRIRM